ncbi:uncharacterized protein [Cardiocondyla obscurior]|uniref:uncharacterized protein n=1 Tax=Cardiocondyla obscurior TaxID=286306 RepID=UPI003965618D
MKGKIEKEKETTTQIYVKNRYGQEILVRALIDLGSEISIISESLAQKLRLPRQPATTAIFDIGERSVRLQNHWPHLQGLELADPDFQESDPVELILGAAVYALIIEDGLCKEDPNSFVALKTSLGWIFSGVATGNASNSLVIVHLCNTEHDLSKLVMRFWQQEKIEGRTVPQAPDDIWCEKHYIKNYKRLDNSRYMVSLPIRKQNNNFLG